MKYIVTSDIHLGHKNTPTEHIIRSFKSQILSQQNEDADVLFVAGDFFDHLLYLKSTEAQQVISFFNYLLNWCVSFDVVLCVLEGTPSHDWFQVYTLQRMNNMREKPATLYYQTTLSIVYLERIQKHVLFIPDEFCKDQQELETLVQQELNKHAITQVDIAILHGQFRYQLQGRPTKAFCYDEAYFLSLVRGRIHIGHYHVYSEFDRIIANGSLERLAHGEEQPKGHVVVKDEVQYFVENPDAYTYITIAVTDKTTLAKLDKKIFALRKGSFVRLRMDRDCMYSVTFQELKVRYADYHLKKQINGETSAHLTATYIPSDDSLDLSEYSLGQVNLYETLIQSIKSKYTLSDSELDKLAQYAQVFVDTAQGAS